MPRTTTNSLPLKSLKDIADSAGGADLGELPQIGKRILSSAAEQKQLEAADCELWQTLAASIGQAVTREADDEAVAAAHAFLNLARLPAIQRTIYAGGQTRSWCDQLLTLIDKTNYTLAQLFMQRAEQYAEKPLFQTTRGGKVQSHKWSHVRNRIFAIARSLLGVEEMTGTRVRAAILSENSLDMACIDLACLLCGIVDVPVPANSTAHTIGFILEHSRATLLFVSGQKRLEEFQKIQAKLALSHVVTLNVAHADETESFQPFSAFLNRGQQVSDESVLQAFDRVLLDDLATIMYTSGTTEKPKGIMFSQRSLISKRFARAIALPEIGDSDKFICYLPLFHTFGRYFEMVGCVFWGATYVFLEDAGIETIVRSMQLTRPSVFISIPKKWIQLFEKVQETVDVYHGGARGIRSAVRRLTGGKLRWGLSAAGYLDPDIFRFFQKHGVNLMSGFGMTEATGGITMTPPEDYRGNSVGVALPGIDVRLAEDGEMLIRGPYVMVGYLDEEDDGLESGWVRTGDIFKQDSDGHLQIIDRKKEIYKNVRGETISPQKIENLFHDFEAVQRVFLAGDHREHNTLLLYPNYDYEEVDLKSLDTEALRGFFSSLIVSVNQFLAPYERITDFSIVDRDFSADRGELTAKGTYKRKTVQDNFRETIERMYAKNYTSLCLPDGFEIRIPTWFLREKALTVGDFKLTNRGLLIKPSHQRMTLLWVRKRKPRWLRVGSLVYETRDNYLDLAELMQDPRLYLGNLELGEFAGSLLFRRSFGAAPEQKHVALVPGARVGRTRREWIERFEQVVEAREKSRTGVHLAAGLIQTWNEKRALKGIDYLETVVSERNEDTQSLAKAVLMRTAHCHSALLKRRAFQVLILNEHRDLLQPVLDRFLLSKHNVLDDETIEKIGDHTFSKIQLGRFLGYLTLCLEKIREGQANAGRFPIAALLRLLTAYGVRHPLRFKIIRSALIKWALFPPSQSIARQARANLNRLTDGFRDWLGKNLQVAVDFEHRREFGWNDVIQFDDDIPETERQRMSEAIRKTPLIREAVFLFSGGRMIHLSEIVREGVAVSKLGALHGKSVYRITIQTQNYGSFDMALNLNESLTKEEVESEINWLVGAGATERERPLVEDFGGYWPEYDLWTEEFVPGETVKRFLQRLERQRTSRDERQMRQIWTSFVWNGVSAYIEFWKRTGRQYEIADPTPDNVVVPSHDFQVGFRIVAISKRKPFENVTGMLLSFRRNFVEPVEENYKMLRGQCSWDVLFSAFLEILGEEEGLRLLQESLLPEPEPAVADIVAEMRQKLRSFVRAVTSKGYKPERLYFAIQRYKRWLALNPDATAQAKLQTLQDLRTTYILDKVEKRSPGAHIQFFRDTVFADSDSAFRRALTRAMKEMKKHALHYPDLPEKLAELQESFRLNDDEKTFLLRLSYPHLGAGETAQMISLSARGSERTTLVVFTTDTVGNRLAIRNPASPKEIARLHKLFTAANLPVDFTAEHEFLIILNSSGLVIGGLFYRHTGTAEIHLEKVVVDEHNRHNGVSDSLMQEFFNRARSLGAEIITVGFLRPQYFRRFGFRLDHRYGNMVKRLDELDAAEPQKDLIEQIVGSPGGQPSNKGQDETDLKRPKTS